MAFLQVLLLSKMHLTSMSDSLGMPQALIPQLLEVLAPIRVQENVDMKGRYSPTLSWSYRKRESERGERKRERAVISPDPT